MNTVYTPYITSVEAKLLQHAAALIAYAATDLQFADTLAHHVQARKWYICTSGTSETSQHLVPADQDSAIRSTNWLLAQLDERIECMTARSMLADWAAPFQSPQSIVIGVVGVDIPPLTLGVIQTKKKKKKMQLVVDQTYADALTSEQLVEKSHELSQTILAKELQLATGKLEQLHPDTADWCMAGSGTKLYVTSNAQLKKVLKEAKTDNLQHIVAKDKNKIVAVAISPCVNDDLVEDIVV